MGLAPGGDGFRLWQDAGIFQAVHSMLSEPHPGEAVWVEMYEFGRRDLAAELLAASGRGAEVRLIVDPTVSASVRTAARLANAGLAVRAYPVDDRRHQIDHVKLLLVGGEALVGGMNWGSGSAANHDYALEIRSPPAVARLRAIFEQDWALAGGHPAPLPAEVGAVLQTAPGEEIRHALLAAIWGAHRSLVAEVFTLTDPEVLAALAAAHRRGVRVRLLLDPGQEVNRAAFGLLLAAGVEARWYPAPAGTKLHAKAALFDGALLLLGSANWSQGGLSFNHELDIATREAVAAAVFGRRFERDWQAGA